MAHDDKRKGEIAYAVLKQTLKEHGFELDQNFRRRVGNTAKKTSIPFAEMLEFSTTLAVEMLAEVSDKNKAPTEDEIAGFDDHGH